MQEILLRGRYVFDSYLDPTGGQNMSVVSPAFKTFRIPNILANPSTRAWAAALAILATAGASTLTLAQPSGGLPVGTKAPPAVVQLLDGTPANLSQFIGKTPVVLEFWATWCPLCTRLEPQFKAAQQKYGMAVTFVSVGVPKNQSRERQQKYVTEKALGGTFVFDSSGNAMAAYKVPYTSHVLVVDRAGVIVYNGTGDSQDLEMAISKALGMPKE
jgi:thiol-disulfide isomerase/thioredoxin